jgi:uncharacterized spore protein YtfJ
MEVLAMTTDEQTAAAYESVPGYDTAIIDARKAGDGGPIDGFVERMAERVGGKASVRAVFGDPIERDGITVIPVARVRWGFGGGAGSGPVPVGPGPDGGSPFSDVAGAAGDEVTGNSSTPQTGSGSGGGGGATADPVGYLEIGPDGATFVSIVSPRPSAGFVLAAGATAALVLRGLARLVRR